MPGCISGRSTSAIVERPETDQAWFASGLLRIHQRIELWGVQGTIPEGQLVDSTIEAERWPANWITPELQLRSGSACPGRAGPTEAAGLDAIDEDPAAGGVHDECDVMPPAIGDETAVDTRISRIDVTCAIASKIERGETSVMNVQRIAVA